MHLIWIKTPVLQKEWRKKKQEDNDDDDVDQQ